MNLKERIFRLIENSHGLAAGDTIMTFGSESRPCRATYSGPNVRFGQVLVEKISGQAHMVYQAVTDDGELVAGRARVTFFEADDGSIEMHLRWRWVESDEDGGISKWREVT
ncbi:MAG: hypothetical protein HKN33_07395 [Pyrinomonadaceae bacterium]|nr:hypothetical protein [Pyrinomonadaceae bacterium]